MMMIWFVCVCFFVLVVCPSHEGKSVVVSDGKIFGSNCYTITNVSEEEKIPALAGIGRARAGVSSVYFFDKRAPHRNYSLKKTDHPGSRCGRDGMLARAASAL
jgi:hypothetical protein